MAVVLPSASPQPLSYEEQVRLRPQLKLRTRLTVAARCTSSLAWLSRPTAARCGHAAAAPPTLETWSCQSRDSVVHICIFSISTHCICTYLRTSWLGEKRNKDKCERRGWHAQVLLKSGICERFVLLCHLSFLQFSLFLPCSLIRRKDCLSSLSSC